MGFLARVECVLAVGFCCALFLQTALAATYTVGGTSGWTIPGQVGNTQLYTSWITGKTFKVGDVLVFNFATGAHDVVEVSKANYDNCGKSSPIASYTTGPVSVPLNTTGAHYYICSFGTHCEGGQKVTVTVSSAATSPKSSPSPSPASPPPVSATPPSTSPPPAASASFPAPSPPVETPSGGNPSRSGAPSPPPSNDNSSASRLTASLGILFGVAALFVL